MNLNNVTDFINEGIKSGICNGQTLAFSVAAVMAVIKKQKKRVPKIPEGVCKPLKDCRSRHFCLKNKGTCPDEL